MSHYKITLKNCAFFAHHGVYDEEKALGQRFFVDAVLDVYAGDALEKDKLEGTVNYGEAFGVIERIITGNRYLLIETLALEIAKALCDEFSMISRSEITVRKPSAPIQGVLDYVEVTIVHQPNA